MPGLQPCPNGLPAITSGEVEPCPSWTSMQARTRSTWLRPMKSYGSMWRPLPSSSRACLGCYLCGLFERLAQPSRSVVAHLLLHDDLDRRHRLAIVVFVETFPHIHRRAVQAQSRIQPFAFRKGHKGRRHIRLRADSIRPGSHRRIPAKLHGRAEEGMSACCVVTITITSANSPPICNPKLTDPMLIKGWLAPVPCVGVSNTSTPVPPEPPRKNPALQLGGRPAPLSHS